MLNSIRQEIRNVSLPFAKKFNLTQLPAHFDILVASALIFWGVHVVIAPKISKNLFPGSYGKLTKNRDKNNWNSRIVGLTHALLIIPLAWKCVYSETLTADKAYGWDDRAGIAGAIACGYFIWDLGESLIHFEDLGFVMHASVCLTIFLFAFQPFLGYYGARFLIWELFLDKMHLTGSWIQLINGLILLSTFIGSRLIYGTTLSYQFFRTIYDIRNDLSTINILVYCGGNITLNVLNWYWASKMISALQRRFSPDFKGAKAQ